MRTVQVFQREFIKRDSSGALGALSVDRNGTGQFHLEVIRNLKSKLSNTLIEPSERDSERSPFAEYYGFFLQDETVEEGAISLYNEIVEEKRIRASKIRSLGKRSYFHEKFRHVFWFNVPLLPLSPSKIGKKSLKNSTDSLWSSWRTTWRTSHLATLSLTLTYDAWT